MRAKMPNTRLTSANRAAFVDAAWTLALRYPQFGYAEIAADLKISSDQATAIVRAWNAEGLLDVLPPGKSARKLYRVRPGAVRSAQIAPQGRTAEDNIWTAMRGLRSFTPVDLAAHSNNELVAVGPTEARAYCRLLLAGGYLRVERKAVPARGAEAIYRLVKDTGPRPPRAARVSAVVDDNTGTTVLLGDRA
jgi:hypothetical protein